MIVPDESLCVALQEWHIIEAAFDYENIDGDPVNIVCVGKMMDPLTSKIAVAIEYLQRTQETFTGEAKLMLESDFEIQVITCVCVCCHESSYFKDCGRKRVSAAYDRDPQRRGEPDSKRL